ncbi:MULTISPECIES: caspase family protein [unclassified Streptomyces]|uniref:caspase family protein n=1 Tax=unclassified Streptomyces TaxID=2593676 RepID=UPI0008978908|nr:MULTISPECIES: caspase family protein [unclassified Streptomyces]SEE55197.1 Caspase domain-containing protein [Streptomyces sp. 2314.4]SEE82002.1 Caspase domain-containing protein [Streptomyces sp. 2112.2]
MAASSHRADLQGARAVLLGASAFHHPGIPPVPAAANSLRAMKLMLTNPGLGGWPPTQVTDLQDPPDAIQSVLQIRRLAQEARGTFLLYYVGHGLISPSGELVLTVAGTDPQNADVTGIEYSRVKRALLECPAEVKIVILDCCYSGRAIEALSADAVDQATAARGVYTLTAADLTAHVPPLANQDGVPTSFTGQLLELIHTGLPAASQWLTLETIYPHLAARLQHAGLPKPNQRLTDNVARFYFVRNKRWTSVGPPVADASATQPMAPSGPDFKSVAGGRYNRTQVDAHLHDVIALVADPHRRSRGRPPYFPVVSDEDRHGYNIAEVDAYIERHRVEPASLADALRMLLADLGIPLVTERQPRRGKAAKIKRTCLIHGDEQLLGFVKVGLLSFTPGVIAFSDTHVVIKASDHRVRIPYSRLNEVTFSYSSRSESLGAGLAVSTSQVITMIVRFAGSEVKIEECNQHPLQHTLNQTWPALQDILKNHPEWG